MLKQTTVSKLLLLVVPSVSQVLAWQKEQLHSATERVTELFGLEKTSRIQPLSHHHVVNQPHPNIPTPLGSDGLKHLIGFALQDLCSQGVSLPHSLVFSIS